MIRHLNAILKCYIYQERQWQFLQSRKKISRESIYILQEMMSPSLGFRLFSRGPLIICGGMDASLAVHERLLGRIIRSDQIYRRQDDEKAGFIAVLVRSCLDSGDWVCRCSRASDSHTYD
jgi:hypothetical protein